MLEKVDYYSENQGFKQINRIVKQYLIEVAFPVNETIIRDTLVDCIDHYKDGADHCEKINNVLIVCLPLSLEEFVKKNLM